MARKLFCGYCLIDVIEDYQKDKRSSLCRIRVTKTHSLSRGDPSRWERELLNKVVMTSLNEGRRARRWGIFFKSLTFLYLFLLLTIWWSDDIDVKMAGSEKHTALVEVNGIIAPDTKASADKVVTGLRNAFEDKNTKGVILRLNTPGGSPVQSRLHQSGRSPALRGKISRYPALCGDRRYVCLRWLLHRGGGG